MRISQFALLTDQNIDPAVVGFLRQAGFDVLDVKEAGWLDAADADLLEIASSSNRLIVTHDSDFGMLAHDDGAPVVGVPLSASRAYDIRDCDRIAPGDFSTRI